MVRSTKQTAHLQGGSRRSCNTAVGLRSVFVLYPNGSKPTLFQCYTQCSRKLLVGGTCAGKVIYFAASLDTSSLLIGKAQCSCLCCSLLCYWVQLTSTAWIRSNYLSVLVPIESDWLQSFDYCIYI